MAAWHGALPFFTPSELECLCCGFIQIDEHFAAALVGFRERVGRPIVPNSVCRCPEHNKAVGGHPRSLHLTENPEHDTDGAAAIDVSWRGWPAAMKLSFAQSALDYGFSLGLHDGFLHLDWRSQLPRVELPQTIFTYGDAWSSPFTPREVRDGQA